MRLIETVVCCLLSIPMVGTVTHSASISRAPIPESPERRDLRRERVRAALRNATDLYRAGRYLDAIRGFESTRSAAMYARLPDLAARAAGNIGGCHFALHQYTAALTSFQEAIRQANAAGDSSAVAVFNTNISSLYTEMGELEKAAQWAQGTLAQLSGRDLVQRPRMMLQFAIVRARQGRMDEARQLFAQAIQSADTAGDAEIAAQGWHRLGEEYLKQNRLTEAEGPLLEAYRIRELRHLPLDASYRCLGRLRLQQGDPYAASALLDRALENGTPTWDMYHYRGRARLAEGRLPEAVADLRIAIRLAREWRWSVLPEDAARIGAEGELQAVHSAFVEAGNRLYQQTRQATLLRETFEAAEENRASSLRALLRSRERELRNRFPPQYWEVLARLQSAELQALRTGSATEALATARADLARMETSMGPAVAPLPAGILESVQRRLEAGTVLLSFHLGDSASWMWSVDRNRLWLQELPPRSEIDRQVRAAAVAVRADRDPGQLWTTLFGRLSPGTQHAGRWILALDGALFEAPLAALCEPDHHLVAERHVLETIPGAGYWLEARDRATAPRHGTEASARLFVGIGDPIYNAADPRLGDASGKATHAALSLPRLVASSAELDEAADEWKGERVLLKGADASRGNLRAQIAGGPAVVHIATHIVESAERPAYGMIALSLTPHRQSELISPFEIAGWRTDASLVVLSGCNSAEGEVLPGTGLLGLTRAWLIAGAHAVIASNWSIPDASGALFRSLYRHLSARPDAGAAEALHAAQIEMIRSGDWRANPRYWGAFFVMGAQ